MAELTVTLIGLGRLGSSIGLALAGYQARPKMHNRFTVWGIDPLEENRKIAQQLGAVEHAHASRFGGLDKSDLIVLATELEATHQWLRDLAPRLREGCVILELSPLKLPTLHVGAEYLPPTLHLIGATATLNPRYLWDGLDDVHHAQADLFVGGTFMLAPSVTAHPQAIELAHEFCKLLGATPHFIDPIEQDGIVAITEGLPIVLGLATFTAFADQDGWGEVQRLSNPAFGRITHRLMDSTAPALAQQLTHNHENVVRQLDVLMSRLAEIRAVLKEGDELAIESLFNHADQAYSAWLKRRSGGRWDDLLEAVDQHRQTSFLAGFLGGYLAERLTQRKDEN